MNKLFKNLNLNLNFNLNLNSNLILFLLLSLFSSVGGFPLFSQNFKDYDPHLYKMLKEGKDPKEIEKLYSTNPQSVVPEHFGFAQYKLSRGNSALRTQLLMQTPTSVGKDILDL